MPELIVRKSQSTNAEALLKQQFTENDEGTIYFTSDQKIFLNTILDSENTENQIVQYGGDVIYNPLGDYDSTAQTLTLKTVDNLKTIYPQSKANLIFRNDGNKQVEESLIELESKKIESIIYTNSITATKATKIGDISVNGSSLGDIKIPTITATQILTSGIEVGKVSIGDTTTTFYTPSLSNYVTLNGTQTISGAKTFSGINTFSNQVKITDTTASDSTTSGALIVSGGIGCAGNIYGNAVYGAVFNDYAEYRESDVLKPGICVCENGDGKLSMSKERLQPGANIISDTFGFSIGKTDKCKTPLAVSGRVLAYPYENIKTYNPGDAVCAGPEGTISKMTREEIREYPERIIGTVSEIPTYKTWGTNNVEINGRIWIKVK